MILGFIGAKLVIHALHTNELPFVNGGEHVTVIPEIPTWLSLTVILGTLLVTTVASLAKSRRDRVASSTTVPGALSGLGQRDPDRSDDVVGRTVGHPRLLIPAPAPGHGPGAGARSTAAPHPSTVLDPEQGQATARKVRPVELPVWFEITTFVGLTVLLLADLAIVARRPHEPSVKEASLWVRFYVGLALIRRPDARFTNAQFATEFYAGWLTEYSLSVDNLFVFVIIMARFRCRGTCSRRP